MAGANENENRQDAQRQFVELLEALTRSGKIEWAKSKNEPGFAYCLAGGELIVFDFGRSGNFTNDIKSGPVGIAGRCKNITYLWLEPSPGFEVLSKLLESAPEDDEKFVEFRRIAHSMPLRLLESLVCE